MRGVKTVLWGTVALVLVALAIPWFLWGDATVVAGLPLWLWWHVGWMVLTAGVFAVFARTAWGVGVETGPRTDEADRTDRTDRPEVAP